jgi:sigma-B regulation protein RsbU (phosphoserine phosphatase)
MIMPADKPLALIAEDSRIQAKVLEQRLLQAGFEVQVAVDGKAALDLAREKRPSVIISDIEMPRMTGYEFCRAVKQDPELKHTPVILLSTLSDAEDIIRGLDAGADNYVTKPYDANFLIGRVNSLLATPIDFGEEGPELDVSLAGKSYRVKSGRQQVLNLLISTFENAVEKNRELHRLNEQLTLAKEKLTMWNRDLESLNAQLQTANQRMSRDLQAAARVQQSLLPSGEFAPAGAQFAWKYTPCEELAGDFLNYFPLDEHRLAMFVVDVSGHGAASSLLAVAIGRLLTAHASTSSLLMRRESPDGPLAITPPAEVALELNRRFPMEQQGGLYFTICYAVLDTRDRTLRYVSAGHPPIVIQSRGQAPRLLESEGMAIGFTDDIDFEEHTLTLAAGDRVYLYSDGVPEAMNAAIDPFGDDRMLALMLQSAEQPVAGAVDSLFEAVGAWCKPKGPKDDVSILCCEVQ